MVVGDIFNTIFICAFLALIIFFVMYIIFSKSNRYKRNNKIEKKDYKHSNISHGAYNENSSIEANEVYEYLKKKAVQLNYLNVVLTENISQGNHFDNFWTTAIYPSIKKAENDMDPAFIKECEVEIRDLNEYKLELRSMYKRKREWLKKEYLPHMEKPLLDFHKLASVICRCIIGTKPISYDLNVAEHLLDGINSNDSLTHSTKLDWIVSNIYVNYKIAFLASIGIVYADLLYWAYEKGDVKEIENDKNIYIEFAHSLENKNNLIFYPEPAKHENFVNSVIIALEKGDLLQRDFDYLFLSVIFYQLQENTKLNLFSEILKNQNIDISDIELS